MASLRILYVDFRLAWILINIGCSVAGNAIQSFRCETKAGVRSQIGKVTPTSAAVRGKASILYDRHLNNGYPANEWQILFIMLCLKYTTAGA